MNEDFERALKFTLTWEGGFSNNPDDAGKETKYGISKKAYPDLDIPNLTLEMAKEIYLKDYWQKANCDRLETPINIVVFDSAVNLGVSKALRIYALSGDWKDYLFNRIEAYIALSKSNPMFLRGWINRTLALWRTIQR